MNALRPFAMLAMLFLAAAAHGAGDMRAWRGGPTPGLALTDLDGREHRLDEYRGRVVLVNFWATWCGPCRNEISSIALLKKKLAGRPFVVLTVNMDESDRRVHDFLARVPFDFPVLMDRGGRARTAWEVRALPSSFLVARDGRVRFMTTGELDWANEQVVGLVSELLPPVPAPGARQSHSPSEPMRR